MFQRAREKASEGMPVIVFFDEMDSIFRTRGSGVSSDVENTIVPQLLSEIDGVEGLQNVIVIGASNREDMIDPAILRPGRLDVKIKIERPDAEAAKDIFSKYILSELPLHAGRPGRARQLARGTVDAMIQRVVERMYTESEENRFLEVTYANGDKEVLYFKDFNSGAMIQNIVDRAKKMAIKEFLETGQKGLRVAHLLSACVDEFSENEDLPNTTNPDDWARISGKKGERIVYIRTLVVGQAGLRGRPIHRHGRPTPASTCDYHRVPDRLCVCGNSCGPAGIGWQTMSVLRVMGTEIEYGISVPGQPGGQRNGDLVPDRQRLPGGARRRRARRARWDFEEENPLRDARGFDLARENARHDPADRRGSGLANVILTNGARLYVDHAHPEYSAPEVHQPAATR